MYSQMRSWQSIYKLLIWKETCNTSWLKNIDVKLIRYQFWCTRCAFRLMKSCQWYLNRKSWKSKKKIVKSVNSRKKNIILCHEIEPNPSKERAMHEGDILRFYMNLWNLLFNPSAQQYSQTRWIHKENISRCKIYQQQKPA